MSTVINNHMPNEVIFPVLCLLYHSAHVYWMFYCLIAAGGSVNVPTTSNSTQGRDGQETGKCICLVVWRVLAAYVP